MIGNLDYGVGLVPIISAGSLLCLCFYNRLFVLVERLRKFDRELIEEYEKRAHLESNMNSVLIDMSRKQLEKLTFQANLVKHAILSSFLSFVFVIADSVVMVSGSSNVGVIHGFYYASVGSLSLGIVFATTEMAFALNTISHEMKTVASLPDIIGMNP